MTVKITLKGNLEFGTSKTYETMLKTLLQKLEVYYKQDYLLKAETYFQAETASIIVPRLIVPVCADKTWRNTLGCLRDAAQFAVSGKMLLWVCNEKSELLHKFVIEPSSEKVTVLNFQTGATAIKNGEFHKAIQAFDTCLEKYPRHSYAYDWRGYARFKLGMLEDAALDFTKSIECFPTAEAYFGRGKAQMGLGNLEAALTDLQLAIDNSVPLQPIFWQARRVKGACHLRLKQFEKSVNELKFVTKRSFPTDDPNFKHRRLAWDLYSQALTGTNNLADAEKAAQESKRLLEGRPEIKAAKPEVKSSTPLRRSMVKS